jgi:hypothetical protein
MTILGKTLTLADARKILWTAGQAFVSVAVVMASGLWAAPNLSNARAVVIACMTAAGAAGLSAVKNWWLADSSGYK